MDQEEQHHPIGLRISADLNQTRIFEDRARQFGFHPLRANTLKQAFGFITQLDRAPDYISVDQDIADQHGERFRDIVMAFRVFVDCWVPAADPKLLLLLRRPLTRQEVKAFKDMGIYGVVPIVNDIFDHYLNQRAHEEIFAKGTEFWPRECIELTPKPPSKSTDQVTLTDRQQEVQKLLCERGLSNKAIARHLNISESTVKIHVSAILKRYGVRNRTQLALAVNNGARL